MSTTYFVGFRMKLSVSQMLTFMVCWILLLCSARASPGYLRPDDDSEGLVSSDMRSSPSLMQESDHDDSEGLVSSDLLSSPSLMQQSGDVSEGLVSSDLLPSPALMQENAESLFVALAGGGRMPAPFPLRANPVSSKHDEDRSGKTMSLPPGQASARFSLGLPPGSLRLGRLQNAQQVRVVALNPSVATALFGVLPARPAAQQVDSGTAGSIKEKAAELQVECACHAPGTARFQVTVAHQGKASPSHSFVFSKSCSGDQLTGLDVGTAAFAKDAVRDGISKWVPAHAPIIAYNRHEVSLYLTPSHAHQSARGSPFQSSAVRIWKQHVHTSERSEARPGSELQNGAGAPSEIALEAKIFQQRGPGKLNASRPTKLTVVFKCIAPSTSLVELILIPQHAWDPFRPVSVFLKKECFGGAKPGFNVGMRKGMADVVHNGRVLSTLPDVGSSQGFSQFFVKYSATSRSDSDQHVRPSLRCADEQEGGNTPVVLAQISVEDAGTMYRTSYVCKRPGVSVCTLSLGLTFWQSPEIRWRKICHGAAEAVTIESSFAQSKAVFGGGQAVAMWAPTNPGVSLAPDDNVAVFTVRSSGEAGNKTGSSTIALLSPQVQVSDPSVLDVIISKENQKGLSPLVFIARHVCKHLGTVLVTIRLPHAKKGGELDEGPLDEVAFAYRKVCSLPQTSFLGVQSVRRWLPNSVDGNVPTGGWRWLFGVVMVFLAAVWCHEFGHQLITNWFVKQIKEHVGPNVFGCEIEVGSIEFRPWSGIFLMKDFVLKNPPGYAGDYLLKADTVSVLTATRRVVFSLGKQVDIILFRLEHIDVNIEFPGYFVGKPNISVVQENVHNYNESMIHHKGVASKNADSGWLTSKLEHRVHDMLECVKLHRAEFTDINANVSHMMGGMQLSVEDMHWKDFSRERKAVGALAIGHELTNAFHRLLQEDVLGETGANLANLNPSDLGPEYVESFFDRA